MVNCVEGLFEIEENNGVDFTAVNIIRPSVRGLRRAVTAE